MTLLVSWIGVDTHGPTSAYIAADSRISWVRDKPVTFDYARKVFALNNHPDILGYCGDVQFPSIVLSQITEMADSGLLFEDDFTCKQKFEAIKEKLIQAFHRYPKDVESITNNVLQVIHLSREHHNNKKFFCHLIQWRRGQGWTGREVRIPDVSGTLFVLGSGSAEFNDNYKRYQGGPNRNTSRNVFHCFCDTLFNISDVNCGGAPQLVGIYRKPGSFAQKYGIIRNRKRYLFGAEVTDLINFDKITWRNDLFEVCDGNTMRTMKDYDSRPNELKRY